MDLAFEIIQWLALLALFASRSVVKKELDELRNSLSGTDRLVQDLNMESMNEILNVCVYCAQPKWYDREQINGGAWVHYDGDGKMVFCGRQESATAPGEDEGNDPPPDSTHPNGNE